MNINIDLYLMCGSSHTRTCEDICFLSINHCMNLMGGEGLPDRQTMLTKVQETDYQTSMEEQADIERAGYDVCLFV
jgi:hypothetical protein